MSKRVYNKGDVDRIQSETGVDAYCTLLMLEKNDKLSLDKAVSMGKLLREKLVESGKYDEASINLALKSIVIEQSAKKMKVMDVLTKYAEHVKALKSPLVNGREVDYLNSLFLESNLLLPNASTTVENLGRALHDTYVNTLIGHLKKEDALEIAKSGALDGKVLFILKNLGKQGYVPDKASIEYKIAMIYKGLQDKMFYDLNDAGAHIRYKQNRAMGQWLDVYKLGGVDRETLLKDFMEHVDDNIVKGDKEIFIKKILNGYLDDHGSPMFDIEKARAVNEQRLSRFEGERILEYKNPESTLYIMNKYGNGGMFRNILVSMGRTSKTVSLISKLGADPELGLGMLLNYVRKKYKGDSTIGAKLKRVTREYEIAMGHGNYEGTNLLSDLTATAVTGVRAASFGAIPFSQIKDFIPAISMFRNVFGTNHLEAAANLVSSFATNLFSHPHRDEIMRQAGMLLDISNARMLGELQLSNGTTADNVSARMNKRLGGNILNLHKYGAIPFKFSASDFIEKLIRATTADAMSLNFNKLAKLEYEKLPTGFKNALLRAGMDEATWAVISKLDKSKTFGLNPETIYLANADDFIPLRRGTESIFATKKRVYGQMLSFYRDWVNTAIPTPGQRESRFFGYGATDMDPNGIMSNVLKLVSIASKTTIKSGSVYTKLVRNATGENSLRKAAFTKDTLSNLGFVLTGGMAYWYMADSLRAMARGDKPLDPNDKMTYLNVLTKSGTLGLVGDYLLGEHAKYGKSASSAVLGPGVGMVDQAQSLVSRALQGRNISKPALKLFWKGLPGNNLWYMPMTMKSLFGETDFVETIYKENKR